MIVHALAVDYDGTVAAHGRVSPLTARALGRVRESGRKLVLVTGRLLPDLRSVCPDADRMFDVIVAENGALMHVPARRETRILGDAPEPALLDALERQGVRFELGASIVATDAASAERAVTAVREAGVERTLVFNKDSLMLLPGGITKSSGLLAALATLELSPHNVVAVGDAENDHAFLAIAECAVAVADAIPALRERADHVTRGANGAGVVELIEEHVLDDLARLLPRLARHRLTLGHAADGGVVTVPAHHARVLVVGTPASGADLLTGVLLERVTRAGRSLCLLDLGGEHGSLGQIEGAVVLGGKSERGLATHDEVAQLLRRPAGCLVLDLSALPAAERLDYAEGTLAVVSTAWAAAGVPHWLVVTGAHHMTSHAAVTKLKAWPGSLALVTRSTDLLDPDVRHGVKTLLSTDVRALLPEGARVAPPDGGPGDAGPAGRDEAVLVPLDEAAARGIRFQLSRRRTD